MWWHRKEYTILSALLHQLIWISGEIVFHSLKELVGLSLWIPALIGIYSRNECLKTLPLLVVFYQSEQMKSLAQLREARLSPGGCVLNSKTIFIFGGRSKSGSVDSIECLQLDLEINWKKFTQKNRSMSHACSLVGVSIRGENISIWRET